MQRTCTALSARAVLVFFNTNRVWVAKYRSGCFRSTIRRQTARCARESVQFAASCCTDIGRCMSRCVASAVRPIQPFINSSEQWGRLNHARRFRAILGRKCACLPPAKGRRGALSSPTPRLLSICPIRFPGNFPPRHSKQPALINLQRRKSRRRMSCSHPTESLSRSKSTRKCALTADQKRRMGHALLCESRSAYCRGALLDFDGAAKRFNPRASAHVFELLSFFLAQYLDSTTVLRITLEPI